MVEKRWRGIGAESSPNRPNRLGLTRLPDGHRRGPEPDYLGFALAVAIAVGLWLVWRGLVWLVG